MKEFYKKTTQKLKIVIIPRQFETPHNSMHTEHSMRRLLHFRRFLTELPYVSG